MVVVLERLFWADCPAPISPDIEEFSLLAERLEIRRDRIELSPALVNVIKLK